MAKLFQITCLVLLLGMIYGWHSSYYFREPYRSMAYDDPYNEDDWFPSSSVFDDIDEMLEDSREDFRQLSRFSSSFFRGDKDRMIDAKKELEAITPNCTIIENSPANQTIELNNRRKQFRRTNTTTCVKEFINNGTKFLSKQVKIIDDRNRTIAQSNYYESYTINAFNYTTPSNSTE